MIEQDIRWKHRFSSFQKALTQLEKFIEKQDLNELEKQGIIQAFEYTYELAWNVLKDYLQYQGFEEIIGPRDAIEEAFREGLIKNGSTWMQMFKDRNKTSHTYNEQTALEIVDAIRQQYIKVFTHLKKSLAKK